MQANAGDVFILPAGLAHKTHNTKPKTEFKLVTLGIGQDMGAEEPRKAMAELELDKYVMMGSSPAGGQWSFSVVGEDFGSYEKVWKITLPPRDPVMGNSEAGLYGLWTSEKSSMSGQIL